MKTKTTESRQEMKERKNEKREEEKRGKEKEPGRVWKCLYLVLSFGIKRPKSAADLVHVRFSSSSSPPWSVSPSFTS